MAKQDPEASEPVGRVRAERQRRRREALESRRRRDAERDAYLGAQLARGETVAAWGSQGLVTDHRLLFAWQLNWPPRRGEWTHDVLTFDEIMRWTLGRRHDHRPLLKLEHPPHIRIEWVPAHHVLWFVWGNTVAGVSHVDTTLSFSSDRDPVFVTICERLRETDTEQGEPFVVLLPGTREERTRKSIHVYGPGRFPGFTRLRRKASGLADRLYRGRVAWRVRIPSWPILAVPAWFIEPWLVVPAIALVEIVWIAGLQWSWHRNRSRRVVHPTR